MFPVNKDRLHTNLYYYIDFRLITKPYFFVPINSPIVFEVHLHEEYHTVLNVQPFFPAHLCCYSPIDLAEIPETSMGA